MATATIPEQKEKRMETTQELVESLVSEAKRLGFTVEAKRHDGSRDYVVTVQTAFTPGDVSAYAVAESDAGRLVGFAPMTNPGTVWGTDGASVGGHAGLTGGYMRLSKSGVGARFGNALVKALAR